MIAVHQRSAGRGGPLARGRIWTCAPQASTAHERPAAASAPDRASALQQQRGCARWPASSNGSVLGDALRGVSALPRPRGLGCAATHDRGAVRPQQERTQERSAPPRCGPTRRFGSRAGRYAAAIEHPADCRARPALPSRLRWPACAPCRSARAATPLRGAPGLRSSLAQGRGPRYTPRSASAGYSQVRRPSQLPPSIPNCPHAAGHPVTLSPLSNAQPLSQSLYFDERGAHDHRKRSTPAESGQGCRRIRAPEAGRQDIIPQQPRAPQNLSKSKRENNHLHITWFLTTLPRNSTAGSGPKVNAPSRRVYQAEDPKPALEHMPYLIAP